MEKKEEAKTAAQNQKNSRNLDRLISENNKKGQRNNSVPSEMGHEDGGERDSDEKMKILINKDGVKEYGTEQDEGQEEEEQGEYGESDYSRL